MDAQFYVVDEDTIRKKLLLKSDAIANFIGVVMLNVIHVLVSSKNILVNKKLNKKNQKKS